MSRLRLTACLLFLLFLLAGMVGCKNKGIGFIPVVNLAEPPGWTQSDFRVLSSGEGGYTIAYKHESGLSLTLYQYARGNTSIPASLDAPQLQAEMDLAREGLQAMVDSGNLESAVELESKVVELGNSLQQALWSRYRVMNQGKPVLSDIYVWSTANHFLKIRCSGLAGDDSDGQALAPLLTSLGRPLTK